MYAIYNVTSPAQAAPLAKAAFREALRLDDSIAESRFAPQASPLSLHVDSYVG